jgi:hypothetical protein
MLNNLGDIETDVLVKMQTSTTIGFYTEAILDEWINIAYRWATGQKKWPFTEGRISTTYASLTTDDAGELVGEYPEGWKHDSIRLLQIGGKRMQKLSFEDYMIYREEQSSGEDKVYTDFSGRYYVNPNADVSGTILAWGQYTPNILDTTDKSALTVFSNRDEDGNEAIVEEVLSYAKKREKNFTESLAHHQKAVAILELMWQRIAQEQFAYHTKDRGIFKRVDILAGAAHDEVFKRDQFY